MKNKLELCFVLLGCVVVFGVALFTTKHMRVTQRSSNCIVNLTAYERDFEFFCLEHGNMPPELVSTNEGGTKEYASDPKSAFRHIRAVFQKTEPTHFALCAWDSRKPAKNWESFANENASYIVTLSGKLPSETNQIMMTERNYFEMSNAICVPNPDQQKLWNTNAILHNGKGNVLFGNAQIEQMSELEFIQYLHSEKTVTNRMIIP